MTSDDDFLVGLEDEGRGNINNYDSYDALCGPSPNPLW